MALRGGWREATETAETAEARAAAASRHAALMALLQFSLALEVTGGEG